VWANIISFSRGWQRQEKIIHLICKCTRNSLSVLSRCIGVTNYLISAWNTTMRLWFPLWKIFVGNPVCFEGKEKTQFYMKQVAVILLPNLKFRSDRKSYLITTGGVLILNFLQAGKCFVFNTYICKSKKHFLNNKIILT